MGATLRTERTYTAPARATMRRLIEIDFEEADGRTTMRFTHSGLWDEEAARSYEGGWGRAFDNLERALGA